MSESVAVGEFHRQYQLVHTMMIPFTYHIRIRLTVTQILTTQSFDFELIELIHVG